MAIPETQLDTWCNQGATVTSAAAYTSIKTALAAKTSRILSRNTEVYLQGSYGNTTNIYADSDVDVVVQLNSVWGRDLSALSAEQERLYQQSYETASYKWNEFRMDVLKSLQGYFGATAVEPGNKAIKIKLPNGRTADVVPTLTYRKYEYLFGDDYQSFVGGVKFNDKSGRVIINYPKEHIRNGEAKNGAGRTAFVHKQTVRMFKNARNCAIDRKLISSGCAPSYFVECVLYNVPDQYFMSNRQQTFLNVLNYLTSTIQVDKAVCQNEQGPLFGTTPE